MIITRPNTVNKKELYKAMDGRISMVSIGEYSDDLVILGKYGIVSWMDGYWDIWITGVHLDKELSSNKVKHLCSAIKTLVKTLDADLNCEAVIRELRHYFRKVPRLCENYPIDISTFVIDPQASGSQL